MVVYTSEVEPIGTETEWSISPRVDSLREIRGETEERFAQGGHIVDNLVSFIGREPLTLEDLEGLGESPNPSPSSFLLLCKNKKLFSGRQVKAFYPDKEGGAYLSNGFRIYKDPTMHIESCTPESRSIFDVVAYEIASHIIMLGYFRKFERSCYESAKGKPHLLFKNNTDGINSWGGIHDNFCIPIELKEKLIDMIPYLITRIIYTGTGNITQRPISTLMSRDTTIDDYFELSPRAAFINRAHSTSAQRGERSLLQDKTDEPLMDRSKYIRFHLSCGDPNMLPYAIALRLGTAKAILEALERDKKFRIPQIKYPPEAIQRVSYHPYHELEMEDGTMITPLEFQRRFCLEPAREILLGRTSARDKELEWIFNEWEQVLSDLKVSQTEIPMQLIGKIDWLTKRFILGIYADANSFKLPNPNHLEEIRWQNHCYHDVDPETGFIFPFLVKDCYPVTPDIILDRVFNPPLSTRAGMRAIAVEHFRKEITEISWDHIVFNPLTDDFVDLGRTIALDPGLLLPFWEGKKTFKEFIELCRALKTYTPRYHDAEPKSNGD